ncbi:MAG: glycogen synthase [Varibaculum sp.]|nr:glycogen synthase [Varibaculum sp.]
MRVDLLTREYPPKVYGGAGVHVTELAKVLRKRVDTRVRCFDGARFEDGVTGYDYIAELDGQNAALRTLGIDLLMTGDLEGADIVHSHTWYANLAGHLGHLLHDVPHVITAHSLEPLRPWKAEQLGGGYRLSCWAEETAYTGADAVIGVSRGMREDILRCYPQLDPDRVTVIHNGLDINEWVTPQSDVVSQVQDKYGIVPDVPTIVFLGRITRQKGLPHLLQALRQVPPDIQVVLCAGAPDTPEIESEVKGLVQQLRSTRDRIVWIGEMLPHSDVEAILAAATVFVTPSIYEPMGIVNLEAAAMGLPVVGTDTGGIPDCIVDGETGYLVPIEQVKDGTGTPINPEKFHTDMAERLTTLATNPQLAEKMGQAGRERVIREFSWEVVADRLLELYRSLL